MHVTAKRCFVTIGRFSCVFMSVANLRFEFPQTTPINCSVERALPRVSALERPDYLVRTLRCPSKATATASEMRAAAWLRPVVIFSLGTDAIIRDSGMSDPIDLNALQHQVQHLPAEVILFLLGSGYCETDRLPTKVGGSSEHTAGWPRVQAICDFVHNHIMFGYEYSRATNGRRSIPERRGVCRDYAHLAVTFCRCLNIPARYPPVTSRHRPPPALCAHGFCRLDPKFIGRPLVRL